MKLLQSGGASQSLYAGAIGLFAMLHALDGGSAPAQTPHVIDASSMGTAFSPGVRGMALSDPLVNTPQHLTGLPMTLDVARGSSVRGPSPGLAAEIYDWRTRRAGEPRPPTLEFLRYAREYDAELVFNVNMRGFVEDDPDPQFSYRYYDTSIATLAKLAGDWVRYTNHIVPTYREGRAVGDPQDAAILNSLDWSSPTPGDSFAKLLSPGEANTPAVRYWEIGNEPRVGVVDSYSVSNGYTFIAPPSPPTATRKTDYRERYAAITAAMRAEDPTIKVGPTLVSGQSATERPLLDSILNVQPDGSRLPVDFISYHPYERMGDLTAAGDIEAHLRGIHDRQASFRTYLRNAITASGREPYDIELMASETNVSYWSSNDTPAEARMAHALGSVETIFSHARLGLAASHYWIWPASPWDGTEYPSYRAFEKLRDYMGDRIINVYEDLNLRMYTTRDSATGNLSIWVLNFDNNDDAAINLRLANVREAEEITQMTLGELSGNTTLFSTNLASHMAGGPTNSVDWTTADLTGADPENLSFVAPAASLSLILLTGVETRLPGDFNDDDVVDGMDYVVWRKGLSTTYTQNDYAVWRSRFGQTAGSGAGVGCPSTAVPEPNSVWLILMAAVSILKLKTRRD